MEMTGPGMLAYKCRRCNKVDSNIHVPNGILAMINITIGLPIPKEWGPMQANMTDICTCGDGGLGISDLIGFEPDPK